MLLSRGSTVVFLSMWSMASLAADTTSPSPTMSVVKMVFGLIVVLGVMALFAWGAKKFLPGVASQPSVIRVVGGASVGTRERVVVLEVAGRWLVVGVASGQVTNIANLEPGTNASAYTETGSENAPSDSQPLRHDPLQPFTNWLKKSMQKFPQK
ncbi:MAG: flagellar biosynthetic protein FliO [Methylophilus sp.]|nr:flagellar biosynthetic protein FliO [Methylophilus sp.]